MEDNRSARAVVTGASRGIGLEIALRLRARRDEQTRLRQVTGARSELTIGKEASCER